MIRWYTGLRVRDESAVQPMACPWCHAVPSEDVCRAAGSLPADAPVRCDRPGCGNISPLSYWHLEGQVTELAEASEEALDELSRLSPEQRRHVEERLRQANDEFSALIAGDDRARTFLGTWLTKNIGPVAGPRDVEVARLLSRLLIAWNHSGIPGPALMRAAGGDLRRFVEDALDRIR